MEVIATITYNWDIKDDHRCIGMSKEECFAWLKRSLKLRSNDPYMKVIQVSIKDPKEDGGRPYCD